MPELDFEADQFLELLTDALRAGPGSPQWHRAVTALRLGDGGSNQVVADRAGEFRLIITARERLESGKDYRSIRPGPEFTRQVMRAVDEQDVGAVRQWRLRGVPLALCAVVLTGALIAIGILLLRRGASVADPAIDRLAHTYFTTSLFSSNFTGSLPAAEWQPIGELRVESGRGLSLARREQLSDRESQTTPPSSQEVASAGGVCWTRPLPADQPLEIQATLRAPKASDNVVAQLFITDDPTFSDDRGTSEHELVWLVQSGQSKLVLPGGRVESQGSVSPRRRRATMINLRILIDRDVIIVDESGSRFWAGAHGLSPAKPRYLGVRFLQTTDASPAKSESAPALTSLKIQSP